MKANHLEFLVEEPSMEAFLCEILPKMLNGLATFSIHAHQGKPDILKNLPGRLRGYSKWLPADARIVVLVDRDDENCEALKQRLETAAAAARLATRSGGGPNWRVVNRLAVEELESWFFGDWASVQKAYPKLSRSIASKAAYRHCDAISGGTWQALERVLKKAGYFSFGLRKVEAARLIGQHFDEASCRSPSFSALRSALGDATT